MYLFMCLDLSAGCNQIAFEIHLDVSEIYFRSNLNVVYPWALTRQLGVNKMHFKDI